MYDAFSANEQQINEKFKTVIPINNEITTNTEIECKLL